MTRMLCVFRVFVISGMVQLSQWAFDEKAIFDKGLLMIFTRVCYSFFES